MTKGRLDAEFWFGKKGNAMPDLPDLPPIVTPEPQGPLAPGIYQHILTQENKTQAPSVITNYIVKGWNGDGLISKAGMSIQVIMGRLHDNAKKELLSKGKLFNKSLQQAIFNEFLQFSEEHSFQCHQLDDHRNFWNHFFTSESPYSKELNHFLDQYCFRVIVIYLLKLRFITTLCKQVDYDYNEADLLVPTHLISNVFKKNSHTELMCESLESNHYTTWYHPTHKELSDIRKLPELFQQASTVEISKLFSGYFFKYQSETKEYSHSLSHKYFGQFINSLLVFYPYWLENNKENLNFQFTENISDKNADNFPRPVICRFSGDNLPSLAVSHWLAQEENCNFRWDEIICPMFERSGYVGGHFLKISYELNFLFQLIMISRKQHYQPVSFICNVIKKRNSQSTSNSFEQFSLFAEIGKTRYYDRIVLNLNKLPTSNAHYHQISTLLEQSRSLKANGHLILLTNQNLFVPSQSDRVKLLQKEYKIDVCINFEHLKGKGEIPNHIYILRKKDSLIKDHYKLNQSSSSNYNETNLSNFRFQGELRTFNHFSCILNEITNFMVDQKYDSSPIISKDLNEGCTFDYFQDAIKDGQLISSSSQDSTHITHPNFFEPLIKSSRRLGEFFHIEKIDQRSISSANDDVRQLGRRRKIEDQYPLVLIIDRRNTSNINIDFFPASSLSAKIEECGVSLCDYFGALPKFENINLNVFRDYFSSRIGDQVVQKSLLGVPSKVKSNLSNLLIPKFFSQKDELPDYLHDKLRFLLLNSEELLTYPPEEIKKMFEASRPEIQANQNTYAYAILCYLSQFKYNVLKCSDIIDSRAEITYKNPYFIKLIMQLDCAPLYPGNDDFNIDFKISNTQEMNCSLEKVETSVQNIEKQEIHFLTLISNNQEILSIYSDKEMINFLKFILSSAVGNNIAAIIQSLNVPSVSSLTSAVQNYLKLKEHINQFSTEIHDILDNLIISNIRK